MCVCVCVCVCALSCWLLLRGAAVRAVCALWRWPAGAAARCRRRVQLQRAAVRALRALWSWPAAGCRCRAAAGVRVVCALFALWSWLAGAPVQGAAAGCWHGHFGAGLLVLQHPAAGCCFKVLLSEWCVLQPLQGVVAGCRCRMLLQASAIRVLCALWNWLAGAATGCGCRVLLWKEGCLHLRNLGATTGHCCQSAVCAVKLGWCRLQVVAARCLWQCGHWPLMEIMFYAVARKGERLVAKKKYFGLSGASMLVQFLSSVGCPIFWHQTIGAPFFSLPGGVVPPGGRQVNITKVRDGPHPQPLQGPHWHRMTDTWFQGKSMLFQSRLVIEKFNEFVWTEKER